MTITLRQESQTGTTTKNDTLTYAELDNNFIDLLTNKILPLQVNADTGVVTVGAAQQNGVFAIQGGTGITTTVTEDSAGNADLSIALTQPIIQGTTTTIYAKCQEAISVGDVVMFAGVQGDHLLVKKAVIDDSAGVFVAEYIVGISPDDFSINDFGYFVTQGQVTHANLNTNSYAPGTILWYDPTTSGGLTATEPTAPNPKVRVAAVLKQNATDGILLVRPTFSRRITDAEDVDTAAAVNNDYLVYNSATGVWQHQALDISTDTTPQLGGTLNANSNNFTNVGTINSHTIPGGTGTFALTSDISAASGITQVHAGTGIQITQEDSAGEVTITNDGMINVSDDSAPELGGNLNVLGFDIVSNSGTDIDIAPNNGNLNLKTSNTLLGTGSATANLTTNGAHNLELSTNNYTGSGIIRINQGASGNIDLDPDGGGKVRINNAYNLPDSDGSNGQVITTDGFGTLSFTTIAGGGGVEIVAGTGITVTQDDSAGSYTISSTVTGGDSVGAGDNIQITNADSAGEKTISFNPNQPINFSDQQLSNLSIKNYGEIVYTSGTTTGTITPDPNDGSVQSITLSGNITLNSLSSVASGDSMTLIVKQPSSGGPYTLSSTMKFAGGTKTLSTTANAIDIITIFYDGTDYLASLSTNFS